MSNIRLLQVVPNLNSGGVERGTLEIAEAVARIGKVSVVTSNGGRLVSLLRRKGSAHENLPVHLLVPRGLVIERFGETEIIAAE